MCPLPLAERIRVNHSRERPVVMISVDLDESLFYGPMKLSDGVLMVATTTIKAIARTVFQVTRYDSHTLNPIIMLILPDLVARIVHPNAK